MHGHILACLSPRCFKVGVRCLLRLESCWPQALVSQLWSSNKRHRVSLVHLGPSPWMGRPFPGDSGPSSGSRGTLARTPARAEPDQGAAEVWLKVIWTRGVAWSSKAAFSLGRVPTFLPFCRILRVQALVVLRSASC